MTTIRNAVAHHRAIVVGSGIAGLTTALHLGRCAVVTKTTIGAGASRWAQGGLAAALGDDDRPALHAADTVAVAGGLADPDIADLVATTARSRVRWLEAIGARFDLDDGGELELGREAGHGRRRIVHAGGDATGAEIMRSLVDAVRARPDITLIEGAAVVDLVRAGHRVAGVVAVAADGRPLVLTADAVVLATGGIGRVYASTTNPVEATGDGLAMAIRAGAAIRNPEFVQFHPTALDAMLDPRPLLTEALRGEGAHLIDESGRRFLLDVHPDAELAPRDVVARANWRARRDGSIHLDCRMLAGRLRERFPTVVALAAAAGLDPELDPLPVSPAQHYHMGGVATNGQGQTSLPGLYACGEVASTGLHGANRLASNSLLEGLVFGTRVAEAIGALAPDGPPAGVLCVPQHDGSRPGVERQGAVEEISALRELMWDVAGVERHEDGLRGGLATIAELRPALVRSDVGRNLVEVAGAVLGAALARCESRGGHHRADFPASDPALAHPTVIEPEPAQVAPLSVAAPVMAAVS